MRFRKRRKRGKLFPAFQFISVTDDCNLKCQGCWVSTSSKASFMPPDTINSIIDGGKKMGSYFYGILGGEPLMHKGLTDVFAAHPDCYFQLFTNGTLFTEDVASKLVDLGNVTPLISLEGDEQIADIRRGGHNIYNRTLNAIRTAAGKGLITGVAVSVCKSNIDMALSEEFITKLHDMGVLYLWYYIFRPAGSRPAYELALNSDEIFRLRKFMVEGRSKFPIILIDSYWRANGEPFCPAADGLSHHINAEGYIEPCPVVQLSHEKAGQGNLEEIYENSLLLKGFREGIHDKTKGCIFMEEPAWLKNFASEYSALNSSNRPDFLSDLEKAPLLTSHGSCPVIPEKNLVYRWVKKTAFFGMGAYG